ncbi:WhiB family transcriptional regulator [Streptomyces sp. TRM 70361]|uniref:WhiB family transcriptional regulator n=1 Tax=Streptomyces sp. TRM 70361 TaxID=3116553 RepID=UPI002E7B6063|nr:WhiB family transcriptional regulator [Streptomyces sp. TRM 70361]MEE1943284.1 WhiB family transcriptional regulator [Streptomyces sp. TRM 70361]
MSRTGSPNTPTTAPVEERIPFPHTDAPLPCRTNPQWFSHDKSAGAEEDITRAKQACRACPIAKGCLKWALFHPEATRVGVWAATTPRERGELCRRLKERLGENWAEAVARRDEAARQRRRQARWNPPPSRDTARQRALSRLELELIPSRPAPYEPWREPITPARAAANRAALARALNTKNAA